MIALPIVEKTGTSCGSGGLCGSSCASPISKATPLQREDVQTGVKFAERRLNLSATPHRRSFVTSIDLDLTVECNLRCTYCFKEKWNEHMEERVAFDTMIWLLHASGPNKHVRVNFMGGEPLIRFKLIRKLVPFAKRRAWQIGKTIHFGITTNGTLVSEEVVSFWRKWGMGFHTSIDGTPEIQDKNRPTVGGKGSSQLVEKSAVRILEYRAGTTARSTVVPDTAGSLLDSYQYFRSLGYGSIAFVPGGPSYWDDKSIEVYESQFMSIANAVISEFRNGNRVEVKGIDEAIKGIVRNERPKHACGAGRGLLLIDIHGDIWPCHRWNKGKYQSWRIGSIYEQFDELARAELDRGNQVELLEQDCDSCISNLFCSGGCPAENLEETGSVYKRHPNACELTRVWARAGRYVYDVLLRERNDLFLATYIIN